MKLFTYINDIDNLIIYNGDTDWLLNTIFYVGKETSIDLLPVVPIFFRTTVNGKFVFKL